MEAELLLSVDYGNKLIDFNVAYCRDGGKANVGWESAGIFPNMHDAIEEGGEWLNDYKAIGFKRGRTTLPRIIVP
jgi:hypothetical protein